jgi:hypothetical protein
VADPAKSPASRRLGARLMLGIGSEEGGEHVQLLTLGGSRRQRPGIGVNAGGSFCELAGSAGRRSGAAPVMLARLQGGSRVAVSSGAERWRGRLLRGARSRKTAARLARPGGGARQLPAALRRGPAQVGRRARARRAS